MDGNIEIQELEQHLLFHKAMSENTETYQRISGYMEILSKAESGERLPDPVDESIRAVFSLVLENGIDPWEVDLSEFVRLYSKKVKDDMFDMIVAGRLMFMAWRILRLQSEVTRLKSEPPVIDEIPEDDGFFAEDDGMVVPEMTLTYAFARDEPRPVTVLELIDAMEEARKEIEIQKERDAARDKLNKKEPLRFVNKLHEDDAQTEIEAVWEMIQKMGAGQICIEDLYPGDLLGNIGIFLAVLHLVKDGRLNIMQESLPAGDIFVEIRAEGITGSLEDEDGIETVI